jgi:predicted anti-sigma-YlaC factor YlaD
MLRRRLTHLFTLLAALGAGGCATLKHTALNQVSDALAAGGTTFSADDDPALIQAAAPFSLKLMESLLAENPAHRGLLLAATSGFTQYAYAFVQQDADEMEEKDVAAATALRIRARRLYLRAHDYGLRGLAVAHPDFPALLRRGPPAAVQACTPADVPLLYWTAASWCAAIALGKDQPALIAELPMAEALIDRALVLDETYDHGTIHAFLVSYEMARAGGSGDPAARAEQHFNRAMALSGGGQASPLVAYAEAVCVQRQDRARFQSLLTQALAINPDAQPESRLLNLVMQRRARWLLTRSGELFLPAETPPEPKT